LPPETQTGANTFGCLVNGQVFMPKGPSLSPILSSYYEYIYPPGASGFVFQISANRNGDNCELKSISIVIDSTKIFQGMTFTLKEIAKGNATARYAYYPSCTVSQIYYYTTNIVKGELFFKKFDETNHIASGTFWFDAINTNNDTVKITDGRFDLHFTNLKVSCKKLFEKTRPRISL